MASKQCKKCGHFYEVTEKKCPNCGAPSKKRIGCLGWIGIIFGGIVILGIISNLVNQDDNRNKYGSSYSPPSRKTTETASKSIYYIGEQVSVGYMSYKIHGAWWSYKLSDNEFLNESPDATFLFIELTVRNDDKKARIIPSFELIDYNDAEYETTSKAWAVDNNIGSLESLNPGVQKKGVIVFDLPKKHSYKLKLSGGYWSTKESLVRIIPK